MSPEEALKALLKILMTKDGWMRFSPAMPANTSSPQKISLHYRERGKVQDHCDHGLMMGFRPDYQPLENDGTIKHEAVEEFCEFIRRLSEES